MFNFYCVIFRHLAKVKVLDLTGPEQRILSGYHAIGGQQKRPQSEWSDESKRDEGFSRLAIKSQFDIPELVHNVELLKESCEYVSLEKFKFYEL